MEYTQVGKTDLHVSRICFGTWAFGGDWGQFDYEQSKGGIRKALELGINFFDTAQAYGWGLSERLLGEALQDEIKTRRSELVLATKGGLRMDGGTLLRDSSPAWLEKGLEESLKNLGTDYIDLYQIHWPDANTPYAETARTLDGFVRQGLIRTIGVSNFDVPQMVEFEKTRKIDALQPVYHLFRRDHEAEILPFAKQDGIGVLVYGPLAHGLLAGSFTPAKTFPGDDWRSKSTIFKGEVFRKNLHAVDLLKEFAAQRGTTVGRVAIAWTLANPAVDVAIVGARNAAQIEATAPAADLHLSPEDLAEIERIMQDTVQVIDPTPEGIW
jgi:aryl-alcohol dehydrogenase-like predicted oxidoreductase